MVPGWWRPLNVGLQPLEHFSARGLESDHLPGLVIVGKVFDEGPELVGVHCVGRQLIIHNHAPDKGSAMNVLEVGVKDFFHILAQLLIDQGGLARLDGSPDFFNVAAPVIGGIGVFAGIKSHMSLDHDLGKLAGVHPVGAVERVGGTAVGGVELVGNGNRENLLFHVKHLSFEYALL